MVNRQLWDSSQWYTVSDKVSLLTSIHPSIHFSAYGTRVAKVASQVGYPTLLFLATLFSSSCVFPGQMGYVLPLGLPNPEWACPVNPKKYIMTRCPNHLNCPLSTWRSSGPTPSSLWMSELFTLSLRLNLSTRQRKLIWICDLVLLLTTQSLCPQLRVGT